MAECTLNAGAIRAGKSLGPSEWKEIRERAIFEFCKWDVQCEDRSVLAKFPLFLEADDAGFLNEKAEALAREALSAEAEILRSPALLSRLGLPRAIQRALEQQVSLAWPELRVMRFDFHLTRDGWRISEVNADVPGGFIEAGPWNSMFAARCKSAISPPDPAERYAKAIRETAGGNAFVALVHATAYSDDRQVMLYLARRFAAAGIRTCLCSPSHLRWTKGRAEGCANFACGNPDVIVRFFPRRMATEPPE